MNTAPNWPDIIADEQTKLYFDGLMAKIADDQLAGLTVYPPAKLWFNAYKLCPFDKVKVVIIGQDPYHDGNAMGLSFSVPKGQQINKSLVNVFNELQRTHNFMYDKHNGDLTKWAEQGVLLINATLTVIEGKPHSHAKYGWGAFTERIIEQINRYKKDVVFLLWGADAHAIGKLVDVNKHYTINSAHPSPMSTRKFVGCGCFVACDKIMIATNQKPINWNNI